MNTPSPSPARRRFRWGRFFLILLAVLVIAVALVVRRAEAIALSTINGQLPAYLNAPARLGAVDIALARGRVTLRDLTIGQPAGFSGEPLLRLDRATAQVRLGSLRGGTIEVTEVSVDHLHAHLIRRAEGTNAVLNALAMLIPQPPAAAPAEPSGPPPAIHLRKIRVQNVGLRFDDATLAEQPLSLTVTNLTLSADGILLDSTAKPDASHAGVATLRMEITQPENRPNAVLFTSARIGVLSSNVPPVDLVARLTGLALRTAGPFYYPGMSTGFGGEATDARVDLRIGSGATPADASLNGEALLTTSAGQVWPIRVEGTLAAPKLDYGKLAMAFPNLAGTAVASVAGNATDVVNATANSALNAAQAGLTGAFKTVGALGTGVFRSAEKAVTGDLKGASASLGDAVTDTAKEAVNTVSDTGGSLVDGVQKVTAAATGDTSLDAWWGRTAERAAKAEKDAAESLGRMAAERAP
jgi:hypothetical protein